VRGLELPIDVVQRQGVALSLIVVLTGLPRITPCKPRVCISRATVQRATSWPSRFNCCQALRTP
jgi:hypothetical protein